MKKLLLVLGMTISLFGMTVQASAVSEDAGIQITEEQAITYADELIAQVNEIVQSGMEGQYTSGDEIVATMFSQWKSTIEEIGAFQEITDHNVTIGKDQVEIVVTFAGENGEGKMSILLDESLYFSGVSVEKIQPMGERMKNAGLNTLLGLGTVFCVLILIIFIISGFTLFTKVEKKPKQSSNEDLNQAIDKAVAQIIEKEELVDDTELVAVIAAAIAASEGRTSTDGFIVRSIRRSSTNKWQKA